MFSMVSSSQILSMLPTVLYVLHVPAEIEWLRIEARVDLIPCGRLRWVSSSSENSPWLPYFDPLIAASLGPEVEDKLI